MLFVLLIFCVLLPLHNQEEKASLSFLSFFIGKLNNFPYFTHSPQQIQVHFNLLGIPIELCFKYDFNAKSYI